MMTDHSKIPVSWVPAHPAYGGLSMYRYWKLLEAAIDKDDGFACHSILNASAADFNSKSNKFKKILNRKLIYPLQVKFHANSRIVHILDHSWADQLPHVPKNALKVVTVHDLIPLRFPGELKPAQVKRFQSWVNHLEKADAIISVSDYTKHEICDILGIPERKIHVLPQGVEVPVSSELISGKSNSDGTFTLGSIGSTLERKNLAILPRALSRLRELTDKKIVLFRVGNSLPANLASELRVVLGPDCLIELGRLPDSELTNFYSRLDALVIPSLYEGFGLPVIEGLAAQIPVVTSNTTSLPEVGGNIPYYFDPHSPDELAAVLADIATNGVPNERIESGLERAKSMSWRKCLEGVYEVYNQVLAEHR
jgi:glycosyltransferase involved in cell wall biosynthesis